MARPMRIAFPGALYHVTVRGNERKAMVRDDQDRQHFLHALRRSVSDYGILLHVFCLMENHYHLVVGTPKANLSAFMQSLQTRFNVFFNRRYRRSGHVVQGRYGAKLVEPGPYLLRLSRYVHLNPVCIQAREEWDWQDRVGILRKYQWSSYGSYIGKEPELDFVKYGLILDLIEGPTQKLRERYRQYVEAGLVEADQEFTEMMRQAVHCVGTEQFQREIQQRHEALLCESRRPEDIASRCHRAGREEEVLKAVSQLLGMDRKEFQRRRKGQWERAMVAYLMTKHAGVTQREVADIIGVRTGAAVSLLLARLRQGLETNLTLRKQLHTIEAEILSFKG